MYNIIEYEIYLFTLLVITMIIITMARISMYLHIFFFNSKFIGRQKWPRFGIFSIK